MKEPYADEVSARRLAPLLILLAAVIALILAVAAALRHSWSLEHVQDVSGSPLQGPLPALETAPQNDLRDYLAQKNSRLESYAWIDSSQHLARIPIEEAMRALAEESAQTGGRRAAQLTGAADSEKNAGADGQKHPGKAAAAKQQQRAPGREAIAASRGKP